MPLTSYRTSTLLALGFAALLARRAPAQQFNSDNYLSKPPGVATVILTAGQRNSMVMTTFALVPGWEFTAAAYIFDSDANLDTDDGYSTSFYAKWMLHENAAKTGGFAVKAGTGLDPGYLTENGLKDAFRTYWMNAPVTIPFLQNRVSLDLMPGVSVTRASGTQEDPTWLFTYSTRLAWYPRGPKLALVGEVFGGAGERESVPEYKAGLRYEPNQYVTFAFTYGDEFEGDNGAGLEIGLMLFTPPFFCISGCDVK